MGKINRCVMATMVMVAAVFSFSPPGESATLNVPGSYATIQDAIDNAGAGDTVLVADGTYKENINFQGKAITVQSENGPDFTTINGNRRGSGVTFSSGEDGNSVLDGFTITNGRWHGPRPGGGIYCEASSPTITNCVINGNEAHNGGGISCYFSSSPTVSNCTINNNTASYGGGGVYCSDSSPTFTDCTISGNTTDGDGGGIECDFSSPIFTNCVISGNSGNMSGGGIYCRDSSPQIIGCTIDGNSAHDGGGISCEASSPAITNCIISGNTADMMRGGGIYCDFASSPAITNCTISGNSAGRYDSGGGIYCGRASSPIVVNCILWGNTAEGVPNEIDVSSDSSIDISYSDIEGGYTGIGNIDADPLLADPANGNYFLQTGSPCIDAANSDPPAPASDKDGNSRYDDPATANTGTGANGDYYDMGAYEVTNIVCTDSDSDDYAIEGGGCGSVDCNDSEPAINPGAAEVCDDGIENDCDGDVDCDDADCVGDPACGSSCVPEAEICDDGVDNDCDGKVDCADKKDCRRDPAC